MSQTATALHDAVAQLDAAVDRLFGPRQTEHGPTASLWAQMVDSTGDRPNTGRGGKRAAGAPAWVDAIDWCTTVERTVREWCGIHDDPQTLLEPLCDPRAWRPQDATIAADHAKTIHAWCRKAERLLDNYSVMEVQAPCPECGRAYFHDTNIYGEHVRKPALEITTAECACNICGTTWPPERFELLAQVLGCTPITKQTA